MTEKNYQDDVAEATADIDFENQTYQIELDTNKGKILLDLYPDVAPNHCKNILGLTKCGFYNNLKFHRIIEGFMIQGGCPTGTGTGGPGYNVNAEFNGKEHKTGALSMARAQDPNSAGSQFFICLENTPHLDGQYTVFGQTANSESTDVVKSIGTVQTDGQDRPLTDVVINKASVISS